MARSNVKIEKIDPNVANELTQKARTTDDLWNLIGPKFLPGVRDIIKGTNLAEADIVNVLAEGIRKPTPKSDTLSHRLRFNWRQHWIEYCTLALMIIGLLLLVGNAIRPRNYLSVKTELPAFHIITDTDVELQRGWVKPYSFSSKEEASGRYLLQPAEAGTILLPGQMSAAPLSQAEQQELSQRKAFTVTVKSSNLSLTLTAPTRARVLFVPRNSDASKASSMSASAIDEAMILSINRQADFSTVVIAVKDWEMEKVSSLLGASDVFILKALT
ncbi:MAG: SAF domain-containing protein [Pyrinomonadaceae bacterium]|nr:SAF domain-containing protein [Pyrinomonadaceae bacterium]